MPGGREKLNHNRRRRSVLRRWAILILRGDGVAKQLSYEDFVGKFEPKKTTDDCYTPPTIYGVIRDWACREYGIDPDRIVRPFYPGGDYEAFDYPPGAVVLDNPPFSILSQICEFYIVRKIPFFLFAPSLTAFAGKRVCMQMNHIICDCSIVYENGAVVRTSFVTSFGGGHCGADRAYIDKAG